MPKILITCGPTWVAIDKVRVISNISSGATGIAITKTALKQGAKVTLLLGPVTESFTLKNPNLIIKRFKYFDELFTLIEQELKTKKYDAVIHLAAVSDYRVEKISAQKIESGKNNLCLKLIPTPKIIRLIKKYDPKIFLVQFKLEVNKDKDELINSSYKDLLKNNSDLVVANDLKQIKKRKHIAYIIDRTKNIKMVVTRQALSDEIIRHIFS
ncbi:MAG: phosphopantothenoylcysteine decarboxylase [Candidatus Omnitrophota bacterium]